MRGFGVHVMRSWLEVRFCRFNRMLVVVGVEG